MYWVDNGTGVTTMPEIPPTASSVPMWFTEGGPGEEPTIPGAAEWNMLQAELLNVLYDADMEPAKAELNQIAKAIRTIAQGEVADGGFLSSKDYKPRRDALGTFLVGNLINNADAFALTPGTYGRYMVSTTKNLPEELVAAEAGSVYLECMATFTNGNFGLVFLYPISTRHPAYFAYVNLFAHSSSDGWHKIYDSLSPPTAEECGAAPADHTHAPPVGAVLFFEDSALNPAAIYPGTTWARVAANQNIRGAVEGETGGLVGGSDTVALSIEHMPNHAHTGGSHVHSTPAHSHKMFQSTYNNYGTPLTNSPDARVAAAGITRSTSDRDDYALMVGIGGADVGVTASSPAGTTGAANPVTSAEGSGAAFSVLNAFYKLHIWKRLS